MHIPIYAYREASDAAFRPGTDKAAIDPRASAGNACWQEGYTDSCGVEYEGISSYPADEGALDAILRLGSTKILVAGHDHVNNTVIRYRGVTFVYSLKCGPGCYWDPRLNGGTVLSVSDKGTAVRHEFVDPAPWLA